MSADLPAPAPVPTGSQPASPRVPAVITRLLASRKFWLTLVALVQTVIFTLWPGFPPDIWKAIDALIMVLVATIAYEDGSAGKLRQS